MKDNFQQGLTMSELRLSTQRALLGTIGCDVLGVCLEVRSSVIQLIVYIEGNSTEDQYEELDIAATEIMADTKPVIPVELQLVEHAKSPLDYHDHWVFLRMGCLVKQQ